MALAGDQHHVRWLGRLQGQGDGAGAVRLGARLAAGRQTAQHVGHDGLRVFAARVVAGDEHFIGQPRGGRAHQRALAFVAVAAAAEHGPEPPAARRRQRAQGLQGFFQRVGRVGVVHHGQRLAGSGNLLHAARHGGQAAARTRGGGQRHAQRAHGGHHAQHIADVVGAHQLCLQRVGRAACFMHGEGQPLRALLQPAGPQARASGRRCAALAQRVAPHVHAALAGGFGQRGALRVVQVDDGRLQAGPGKQRGLGLPVSLHAAVPVQMVLREVGEHGHAHGQPGHAALGQADGRGLHRARARAFVQHAAQPGLQLHGVGRGQARGLQAARQAHAQSARKAAWIQRRQLLI